ncbi:hypothetical protein AB1Y20_014600 [Prymnesium parvum]|uniref:C2H2-type domain-containing protein n=1 Tax=Prymnesium parvum TaxID=97485 RepID=A0AB34IDB9_PRYPA
MEAKRASPPNESEQSPKRHAPDGASPPSSEDAPSAVPLPSSPGAATAAVEGLPSPTQPLGEAAAPLAAVAVAAHPPFTGQLPPPTIELRELARRVMGRLKEWNLTQSALCVQLALSPVYFSCWLRERELPKVTKQLYSSALEAWMADPHFNIQDPSITGTPSTQVARPCRGRGRGAGGGGGGRRGRPSRPSPSASRASAAAPHPPLLRLRLTRRSSSACASPAAPPPLAPHPLLLRLRLTRRSSSACASPAAPPLAPHPPLLLRLRLTRRSSSACASPAAPPPLAPHPPLLRLRLTRRSSSACASPAAPPPLAPHPPLLRLRLTRRSSACASPAAPPPLAPHPPLLLRLRLTRRSSACASPAAPPQLLADASTSPRPLRELSAAFVLVTASLRRETLPPSAAAEGGGEAAIDKAEGEADATLLFRVGGRRLASLGADDVLVEEDAAPHAAADRGRGSRLRRTLVEMAANAPAGGMAPFAGELGAICAVCDQRFERASGALQLCAHAALHLLHENLELRRRCELNPALAALRGAANVDELRAALDVCRRLTAEVPDVPLQRATFKAERRLRTMVANKNRPPPVVPPASAHAVPPLPRARVAAPPAVAPHRQAHLPTALPPPPPTWLPSPSRAAEHANSCIGQKPTSAAAAHRPLSSSCGGVPLCGERGAAGQAGEGSRHAGASRTPPRVEDPTQLLSKLPHAPPTQPPHAPRSSSPPLKLPVDVVD